MPTQPIRTLESKHFVVILTYILAIALFAAIGIAQQLHQGVSVQMATTTNAQPMPAADDNDAWVVTITADGQLYFGFKPVSTEQLLEQMKSTPRNRAAKLYIKADARTPFAAVKKAFDAGREVSFQAVVLLTAQRVTPVFGHPAPPDGLGVLVDPSARAGVIATVVQLLTSGQAHPSLSVNGDEIPWSELESTLRRHFEKGDARVILLKADERLPFGQVVQAIDAGAATRAQIIVETAGI